jgi:hypothetical protein
MSQDKIRFVAVCWPLCWLENCPHSPASHVSGCSHSVFGCLFFSGFVSSSVCSNTTFLPIIARCTTPLRPQSTANRCFEEPYFLNYSSTELHLLHLRIAEVELVRSSMSPAFRKKRHIILFVSRWCASLLDQLVRESPALPMCSEPLVPRVVETLVSS